MKRILVWFFVLSGYIMMIPSFLYAIPIHEREALIELYEATEGDEWRKNTNWLKDPGTECTWYGIVCNGEETAVIEINLNNNNLYGH